MSDTILASWVGEWPEVRVTKPAATGAGVLDPSGFNVIEVDEVFDNLNHAETLIGQAVLYRSLARPSDDLEAIRAKQQAVQELKENAEIREQVERIVQNAKRDELGLYQLLYGNFIGMFGTAREVMEVEGFGYEPFRKATRMMTDLVSQAETATPPKSAYLQELYATVTNFAASRVYALLRGPVYKTEKALQTKEERKHSFAPAFIFRPRLFKPLFITAVIILLAVILNYYPMEFFGVSPSATRPVLGVITVPLILLYIPFVGTYDRDNIIYPLRNEFKASPELQKVLDALGQLDELLALNKYAEAYGGTLVMPQLLAGEQHRMQLEDAKNPVLGKANPAYVGNDFSLQSEKLVLITGPNSGGKTAFCKTVTQIQLLAQIGCYVPAQAATMTVADRIFYQVPEISHLDDGEGRFGTELKRTRDIFLAATPRSLVVLDELSEGTTFEEKLQTSVNILDGFYQKGNNTILITHNHQLVDHFAARKIGMPKQVEFANDAPTYRLIDGISRVSHADRVAKKIGFSKEDIQQYLAGKQ
ncbi:MAG: MutS-related protein [Gammaproteobacteria bacterium]